jgi:hypothetical protein
MTNYFEHDLLNGSSVGFFDNPLHGISKYHDPKPVNQNLGQVLLPPEYPGFQRLHISANKNDTSDKIFLGFSSANPNSSQRFGLWIPPDFISSHILIGGSIGSGKTSLTYRLLAGALNTFGTVVIGEAKGGLKGFAQGAAYTNLAEYLAGYLGVKSYRWPRGNCWFNPFFYLQSRQERKEFLLTLSEQVKVSEQSELQAYIRRAAEIASLILEFLVTISTTDELRYKQVNFSCLISPMKDPEKIIKQIEECRKTFKNNPKKLSKIESLKKELTSRNFFAFSTPQGREKFVMTATGLRFFIDLLDNEDLLYYTRPQKEGRDGKALEELKIDEILYNRSLVVISQPLNDSSSQVIGPIFWDALLNRVLELGPNPKTQVGKPRQKVAVFLDETHRLPVGKLGNSGDFLRQYNFGLIEITPTIVDKERWEQNKHIYQTIISLSPGCDEVVQLVHDRLPSQHSNGLDLEFGVGVEMSPDGRLGVVPKVSQGSVQLPQEEAGVSVRLLRNTGRYTALLQSNLIRYAAGVFWIDLESDLLMKFDLLLEEALSDNVATAKIATKIINYALGLVKEFIVDETM